MTPFLYANQNRHAPRRANGLRFWGYPSRAKSVRLIVIHTAENTPDYVGEDGGAEAVARFQAGTDRPSSYHELVDSDSHVVMLPPDAVAFGAVGANADGWHLSFATRAHLWPGKPPAWKAAALARGAARASRAADLHGIPVRRLTRAQIADGRTSGFASHADTEAVFGTPGRRSDPGAGFPWDDFLRLVAAAPNRPKSPASAGLLERIRTMSNTELDQFADLVARKVVGYRRRDGEMDLAGNAHWAQVRAKRAEEKVDQVIDAFDIGTRMTVVQRVRHSLRALGKAAGLKVDVNGTPGEDITA